MKSRVLQLFAFELAIGHGADAWFVSWPRDDLNWFPPRQTHAIENRDTGTSPVPTSAPQLDLFKRDDDVCGYVSGHAGAYSSSGGHRRLALTRVRLHRFDLRMPQWRLLRRRRQHSLRILPCRLLPKRRRKLLHRLHDMSRLDAIEPLPRPNIGEDPVLVRVQPWLFQLTRLASASRLTTANNNSSESDNPFCVTYSYGAGTFSGYSWFACGESKVIRTVFRSPTDGAITSGTTPTSGSSSPTSNSHTATTTPPTNPAPVSSDGNSNGGSAPVGAIVGGVVGGIGTSNYSILEPTPHFPLHSAPAQD